MCGIAGFWQAKAGSEPAKEMLLRMGTALLHRGPDDSGIFHDAQTGVGFSFRRLAIVDLSEQGHQPMPSASGRYVIVFNGEVYNYEEIRKELGQKAWRGHSDTEVMLEAIETWGLEAAVRRFIGMFAFALWDRHERKLHLVRDRIGIKPLYYGTVGGDFVFASELKAVAQHPEFDAEVDRDVLALYLRHNCVPAPHCIYKGIGKLQPGCILTLSSCDGTPDVRPFWSAIEVAVQGVRSPLEISDSEGINEVERTLMDAVKLRMIADVPLGAFLSGGVDSTTIVALMQAQSNRPVKTFTIGSDTEGYNEARHAKKVAEHLGTDHTELYVTGRDALDVIPLLSSIYDEPFSDSSQIPTYLVSKLARREVTVSLSGDGGDELFGGYNRYLFTKRLWKGVSDWPIALGKILPRLMRTLSPAAIDHLFTVLRPILPAKMRLSAAGVMVYKLADLMGAKSLEAMYLQELSHWERPEDVVLQAREPNTVSRSIAQLTGCLPSLEEQMMLTDLRNYLPDDILTKLDRASMAASLEARVPILDHRVVELAWKLPIRFKIRDGVSKWALRQILYKYVPQKIMDKPKWGFGIPMDTWLRGPLREWAEDLLDEKRLKEGGFFNAAVIRSRWKEHLRGAGNWQFLLWDVLVFQDWLRAASMRRQEQATPIRIGMTP
jgi:asparagine synthase (glutamine-hydrolysing)